MQIVSIKCTIAIPCEISSKKEKKTCDDAAHVFSMCMHCKLFLNSIFYKLDFNKATLL